MKAPLSLWATLNKRSPQSVNSFIICFKLLILCQGLLRLFLSPVSRLTSNPTFITFNEGRGLTTAEPNFLRSSTGLRQNTFRNAKGNTTPPILNSHLPSRPHEKSQLQRVSRELKGRQVLGQQSLEICSYTSKTHFLSGSPLHFRTALNGKQFLSPKSVPLKFLTISPSFYHMGHAQPFDLSTDQPLNASEAALQPSLFQPEHFSLPVT